MAYENWGGTTDGGSGPAGPPDLAKPAKQAAPWVTAARSPVTPPLPAHPVGPASPPPPVAQGPDQGRPGRGRRRALAAVVACLAAAAVGITWIVQREDGTAQEAAVPTSGFGTPLSRTPAEDRDGASTDEPGDRTSDSGTASTSSAPTTSTAPTRAAMTEEQALSTLQELRNSSLAGLVLDSRWVAQAASKSVGITDPLQVAANGTHTFFAVDILAESRAVVASVADPSSVLVLQSSDFGKRSSAADGQRYWVTLVDAGFTSSEQVKAWCASTYPTLTPEQLANACAPRTLAPPHD